jgi:pilus assembly protein CpaE
MTSFEVIAVGAPPTFRQQVARAMERDPRDIEWMPTVSAVEEFIGAGRAASKVIVLSPVVKEPDAFGLAEFLGRVAPATALVMVRDRELNGLLPTAMRAGVRDVVNLSRGSHDLREALERAMDWSARLQSIRGAAPADGAGSSQGSIFSVFSSKGGAGKSFLSSNLAASLAQRSGEPTALVDFDLEFGDTLSYFGRDTKRSAEDLIAAGASGDPETVRAAGIEVAENLWAFGSVPDPGTAPAISGEAAGTLLRTMKSTFRHTVVDASATYSDHALASFDLSDAILLVTGLDVVGIRHLSIALDTLLTLGFPRERFRVVLNRADSKVGLSPSEVERVMKLRVDAMIPSSRLVPLSLNKGTPVCIDEPRSEVAKSVFELADKLSALVGSSSVSMSVAASNGAEPRRRRGLFKG